MKSTNLIACCLICLASGSVHAAPFDGRWTIDLRTPAQVRAKAECGSAIFVLEQDGQRVTGDHQMATAGCGRLNEGGQGSVQGVAHGNSAELTVTSGRNGEVVRGRATRVGSSLRWRVLEQVRPGEPEGDSWLILWRGTLQQERP